MLAVWTVAGERVESKRQVEGSVVVVVAAAAVAAVAVVVAVATAG